MKSDCFFCSTGRLSQLKNVLVITSYKFPTLLTNMPPLTSLKLLILAGSLSIAAPALHAQIVPGSQSNVTLTLTSSFTEDNDPKIVGSKTIFSGRIVKEAFGNKQFIAGMNAAGDLPDNTVTGWKLVMVNRDPEVDGDSDANPRSFYLVKAGQTPVPVPYLSLDGVLRGSAATYSDTVDTANVEAESNYYQDPDIVTGKTTAYRAQVGLYGSVPGKFSNVPFKFVYRLVSAKLGGLVGSLGYYDEYYEEYYDEELIEGSVSFSAETPIDISSYPAPAPE